jgi:hypothetical protein
MTGGVTAGRQGQRQEANSKGDRFKPEHGIPDYVKETMAAFLNE